MNQIGFRRSHALAEKSKGMPKKTGKFGSVVYSLFSVVFDFPLDKFGNK